VIEQAGGQVNMDWSTLARMSIGGRKPSRRFHAALVIGSLLKSTVLSREALEFFYAHMGEAEAHWRSGLQVSRENTPPPGAAGKDSHGAQDLV
jgi:hypothetical protein